MKKFFYILILSLATVACNNNSDNDSDYNDYLNRTDNQEEENTESAKTVLTNFIYFLGDQNYSEAYKLTNNPDWGSYSKFSSTNAFGAITGTYVKEMKVVSEGTYSATLYAEVKYTDPKNGTNTFKQNFFLEKSNNEWVITKMEVVKSKSNNNSSSAKPQYGQYGYSNNRSSATLNVKVLGNNYFDYDLVVGNSSACTGELYDERAYYKNGKWSSDFGDDCIISFEFSSNSVKITETNCIGGYLHGMSCSFDGTYYKE